MSISKSCTLFVVMFTVMFAMMATTRADDNYVVNPILPIPDDAPVVPYNTLCPYVCPGVGFIGSKLVAEMTLPRCPPSYDPQIGIFQANGWDGFAADACNWSPVPTVCPNDGCEYDRVRKSAMCPPGFDLAGPGSQAGKCIRRRVDPNKTTCCDENGSNPINTATGVKHQFENDFEISRPLGLSLTRHYNSAPELEYWHGDSDFGQRWSSSLQRRVSFSTGPDGVQTVAVQREHGGIYVFVRSANDWVAEPDIHDTLTEISSSGGAKWEYRPSGLKNLVERYDETGNLIDIESSYGASVRFDYTADFLYGMQKLAKITDQSGRVWQFFYDSRNRINRIDLPNGQSISYEYDNTYGILRSVSYPGEITGC